MNKHTSHWTRWGFAFFGGLLILINGALTFAFGYSYLGTAFGAGSLAFYAGAFYALLLFDAGYLSWFYTFIRTAESTGQRALALGMAVFSLMGSLAATLQQLATNATALVDLTEYHQAVGMVALGAMLFMTAAHIIATASYLLLDPRERVKQVMAGVRANALDDSLTAAEKLIALDHKEMIDIMSADVRADILAAIGFTADLRPVTRQNLLTPAPSNNGNTNHTPDIIEHMPPAKENPTTTPQPVTKAAPIVHAIPLDHQPVANGQETSGTTGHEPTGQPPVGK